MRRFTLILFICGILATSGIISDPYCVHGMNQYGNASFNYDILGQSLNLTFKVDLMTPLYSCYLCRSVSGDYCNATTANIDLSYDLAFNVMTLLMRTNDSVVLDRQVFDLPSDQLSLQLSLNGTSEPLRLIVILFCTIERPSPLSFLTMLRDRNDRHRLVCDNDALLFEDIDCSVLDGYYYYIPLDLSNSITGGPILWPPPPPSQQNANRPLFYWYKESIVSPVEIVPLQWCGLDWVTLLSKSGLSYKCGNYAHLYVDIKPWYQLALEYTVARLNIASTNASIDRHLGETLLLANEILERTCLVRNDVSEPINNTIFASTYTVLRDFNTYSMDREWCLEVSASLNRTDMDAGLVPFYVSLYSGWYFRYFSPFILYSSEMWHHVIIAIAFLGTAATIFVFCITVLPIWFAGLYCYYKWNNESHFQVYAQYEQL